MKILNTNFKRFISKKVTGQSIFNKNNNCNTQIDLDIVLPNSIEFPLIGNL